ncbi:MAG: DUF4214 domain-containing protein [Alphaproteobacteria bacterium]|nr:DUF4214 domain-containing protein [Alphaproteobacteria bacterium]MBU2377544.1 DUF4214 domain-containing protein [Alphaproteobacteria bacterium]
MIIARLYDATLDRLPDPAGLAGWVAALDGGMPLDQIAGAFVGSAEFQQRYGALSNQAFVEQLYRFCLDREGEPAGVNGWVNLLNSGTSRTSVVIAFSESPEHIGLTAPFWSGGIRYAGYAGAPLEDVDGKDMAAQVSPLADPVAISVHIDDAANDDFLLPGTGDATGPDGSGLAAWPDAFDVAVVQASAFDGFEPASLLDAGLIDAGLIDVGHAVPGVHADWM